MLKVVIDTNIVISSLLKSQSLPALIISLVLQKKIKLYLSVGIYSEYQGVLNSKKFKKLDKKAVKKLLADIKKQAIFVKPQVPVDIIKKDPDDNKFLECALSASADYLITGNTKHFTKGNFHQTKILTPSEFALIFISYLFSKTP